MSVIEKFTTMEYGPAPEDPKESLLWLDRHQRRFGHFINGKFPAPDEDNISRLAILEPERRSPISRREMPPMLTPR